jgi:thiol:disulfide interchange protein DsbC
MPNLHFLFNIKTISCTTLALCLLALAPSAWAKDTVDVSKLNPAEKAAHDLAVRGNGGRPISSMRKVPDLPFYEFWFDRMLAYTDLDAKVYILGNLFDSATMSNIRESRISELMAVAQKDIPLSQALKTVRGNGKHSLVVFSDPNCGFCKQYEASLAELKDVTIYTLLYPVLGPDSLSKSRDILCAPKPEAAWRDWMDKGIEPPKAKDSCQQDLAATLAFGRDKEVGITPTTFFANGRRYAGTLPPITIQQEMAKSQLQ